MNGRRWWRWLWLGMLPSLSGCVMCAFCFRSEVWQWPTVAGVVSRGGVPVVGASVRIAFHGDCDEGPAIQVVTDSEGQFQVEGHRTQILQYIGDPGFHLQICLDHQDNRSVLIEGGGIGYMPEHIAINCDLGVRPNAPTLGRPNASPEFISGKLSSNFCRFDP